MHLPANNTYILPVGSHYMVYSPLNGISAVINHAGALELKKQLQLIVLNQAEPESALFDLARHIFSDPVLNLNPKTGELNPDLIGIIPTRTCNGACNYCDFNAKNALSDRMSLDMARAITDWFINQAENHRRESVNIHFFGGEPMVASDVIEVVVHRSRMLAS